MQLYRTDGDTRSLVADIDDNQIIYLHPSIQRIIDLQKCIVIPAIRPLMEQFGGSNRVPLTHPKFSKAVKIYLDHEIVTRTPTIFQWIHGKGKELEHS
jgi:hypothetical protein